MKCDTKLCDAACCKNIMFEIFDPDMETWVRLHGIRVKEVNVSVNGSIIPKKFADFTIPCTKLKNNRCTIHDKRPDLCRRFECDRERWKNASRMGR